MVLIEVQLEATGCEKPVQFFDHGYMAICNVFILSKIISKNKNTIYCIN